MRRPSNVLSISLVALFAAACAAGTSSSNGSGSGGSSRSATCPPAGTRVPFLQIVNDTPNFIGCPIETEVAFMGPGDVGSFRPWLVQQEVLRPDEITFSVAPPNQVDMARPGNAASYSIAVARASAGALYDARGGTVLKAAGQVKLAYYGSGLPMWLFSVSSFEPVALPSAPEAPTPSSPQSDAAPRPSGS